MVKNREAFFASLDQMGETEVRARLAEGKFAEQRKSLTHEWLRREEDARASAAADRAEAAASRMESLSKEHLRSNDRANELTKKANIIAVIAAIVATIAAITSIISSCSGST